MREGLAVGRSLSAAAIVRLGGAGVNGLSYLGLAPQGEPIAPLFTVA